MWRSLLLPVFLQLLLLPATKAAGILSDSEFTPCKTCIFVLEQIKTTPDTPLPALCSQIYLK